MTREVEEEKDKKAKVGEGEEYHGEEENVREEDHREEVVMRR